MFESMKKTFLASLGVIAFTREKLEQTIQGMVHQGELTRDQGASVISALLEKGDTEGRHLVEKISQEFEKILALGPLATKAELHSLLKRVEALEQQGAPAASDAVDASAAAD